MKYKVKDRLSFLKHKLMKAGSPQKTFTFQGKTYPYFHHGYNRTWANERAVEIPIVWSPVLECRGKILEVGNVLGHYFPFDQAVVDKYEKGTNVINADI